MIKNKVTFKILIFIIIFVLMILNNAYILEANATEDWGTVPGLGDLDSYKADSAGSSDSFNDKVNNVIGVIRIVGSIVSVVTLVALGIKYMFGSIEERAEYKETMKPYLIGAILVFGISNVTSILYDIGSNMF